MEFRRPDQIGAEGAQLLDILGLVARIAGEVLVRTELGRVDEDADHDTLAGVESALDQRQMPAVQGAHGRHQSDPIAGRAPGGDPGAQIGGRPQDRQGGVGNLLCHVSISFRNKANRTAPSGAALLDRIVK